MKICLGTIHRNPRFIPLALLYLEACLVEKSGVAAEDIAVVEFGPEATARDVAERIVATGADVLGLSCYVWNIRTLMAAAEEIKRRRPSMTIVLGGPEVGPLATETLERFPAVDVVVKSEGEGPFGAIVEQLASGVTGFDDVAGICFRRGARIVDTGEAPILRDLNSLPSPHTPAYATTEKRIVCVETQRGCVFRCNFCFYNKDLSIRNRRFDLDRVTREIQFWLERDIIELYLMDPVFNLNAERAKEICRFIAEHNTRGIPIHAEVWAEFIDEELAELMRLAHVDFLEVGLQTTDDNVLATVERRLRMQQFIDGIGHLKANGLKFEVQLIYGLPGETRETFRRSLNFAASLDPPYLAVFPLMVLPGTELWRKADGLQMSYDADPPYYVRSHFSMSESDIAYGWKVTEALEWLDRPRTIRLLCREQNVGMADIVDAWLDWSARLPGGLDKSQQAPLLAEFIDYFCETRSIPPDFYRAFAAVELATDLSPRAVR